MLKSPPPARAARTEIADLFKIAARPELVEWQPFRAGVEIHRLYGDGVTGPSAALLRYAPGGAIPCHEHGGYEHILILAGSQRDAAGELRAGTLAIHAPGTSHDVVSDEGCIALAIYERPVRFVE